MAGLQPTSGNDVNTQLGVIARNVFAALADVKQAKDWLDTMPDNTLTSPPFNMTSGDVAVLKSAFADLAKLAAVFEGTQPHSPAADLRGFARQTIGINS
ncbi:hypothetical protein GCM10022243_48420 [Saccharothrix violaceirubra]|uniref:Uncharacterized protein n=1 Tax=Saccharothrix violaceirubra TaxID=413306 RepID=A0A7W7SZH5_9PSEU|nr:hypothetical protein [Saccharothrix violaceirubra]MBB4963816.1 hypothetical protein [Saccharothrix violaceirubra]